MIPDNIPKDQATSPAHARWAAFIKRVATFLR
jgi:hypothetical protein